MSTYSLENRKLGQEEEFETYHELEEAYNSLSDDEKKEAVIYEICRENMYEIYLD